MKNILMILAMTAIVVSCGTGEETVDQLELYESFRSRALESREQGDLPLALRNISKALNVAPTRREPYELASKFHIEMGADAEAVRYFMATVQIDMVEDQPWPWYFAGYHQFRLGQLDAARENFIEASSKNPDEPDIHLRIGLVHEALGDPANALKAVRRASELNPDSTHTVVTLARLLRASGDWAEAELVVTAALNTAPTDPGLLHSIGMIRLDQHLLEYAETAFRKVLELHPEYMESRRQLVAILKQTDRTDEAIRQERVLGRQVGYQRGRALLTQAAASSPGDPGPALALAELELTEKRYGPALRWYSVSEEAGGPGDRIACGKAEALFGLGMLDKGDLALGSVSDPTTSRVAMAQAMRAVAAEDFDSVRGALDRAMRKAPEDRLFLLRGSDLYLFLDDIRSAENLWERSERMSQDPMEGL